MIKKEDFEKENTVRFYYPNEEYFGDLTNFECLQLQLYVIKNQIEGFHYLLNKNKVYIDLKGELKIYPIEFSQTQRIFANLFTLKKQKNDTKNN